MAGLQQKKIKDSYKSLLRVDDDTHGIDGSLANITDGEGTTGPFQISSTEVSFPSSSTLSLVNLKAESATQGFHINLTDSNGDDKNKISIPDNVDTAFSIKESGNLYMKFTTTNGSEIVEFGKDVEMQGNLQVNGTIVGSSINFNSVDMDNVDIDSGTIDGTTIGASSASTGAFTTLTASGDVNFDSNTLFVDSSNNRVGIGTNSVSSDATFGVSGNIELKNAGDKYWIPRQSDGALTGSIYSRTGSNVTISGAGSSSGQIEFIPSSANSSAVTLTLESSGRMVASSVLSAGTDYLDGDASLYLANSGSDGTMIKFGDTNAGLVYGGSGTGTFKLMQRENTALSFDASRNATFAGDLTISNSIPLILMNDTSGNKNNQIIFQAGGSNIFRIGTDITTNNGTQLLQVTDGDGNNSRIEVNSSGFVGIQSNDTSGDLNLAGSFGAPLHILQKPSSQSYGLVVQGNSNANGARLGIAEADSNLSTRANTLEFGFDSSTDFIFSRTGKDMIIGVNSSERMRITSDGKVGIGETSPAYKLDLASSEAIVSQFTGSSGETILSLDNTSTNGDKWYLISGGSGGSFSGGKFGIYNADTTTAVATFTNDGNVGIGDTSPTSDSGFNGPVLRVKGSTSPSVIARNSSSGGEGLMSTPNEAGLQLAIAGNATASHNYIMFRTGNTNSNYNSSERMRITSDGKVGIGATNLAGQLHVKGSGELLTLETTAGTGTNLIMFSEAAANKSFVGYGSNSNDNFSIYNYENAAMIFATDSTQRMYIANNGGVAIGTNHSSPATLGLHVKAEDGGQATFIENSWNGSPDASSVLDIKSTNTNKANNLIRGYNGGSNVFAVEIDGDVNNTNNSYGAISDERLKENIADASSKLDELNQVRVVNYNFKDEPDKKQLGVVAQELQEIFPKMVSEYGEDGYLSVKYSIFVPMLIKAVQELSAQNDALTARIEALEA